MPAVLDVAGMRKVAERLRALGPVLSFADAEGACLLLSQVRLLSDGAADGWAELVEEAAFWAEAAVRSALDGDKDSFAFCVGRVRGEMDAGWALLQVH
jgi:hypothetical protein